MPGLPPHIGKWVEQAWSGEKGFGPYSPVYFAGRYYDLDSLDQLSADVIGISGESRAETKMPSSSLQSDSGGDSSPEKLPPSPEISIRRLADPAEIRCQFELGAEQTWPERKSGGPLAFCGHHLLSCKTALWADLIRRYGAMGLIASLNRRECGMVTFVPKPIARLLGWATSPENHALEHTLSVACLVVQPYARGRGVAKALVNALGGYARENGYRRVEAATTSRRTAPDHYGWQTTELFTGQGWQIAPGAGATWLPVMVALEL